MMRLNPRKAKAAKQAQQQQQQQQQQQLQQVAGTVANNNKVRVFRTKCLC
jgi:hypothetical protein